MSEDITVHLKRRPFPVFGNKVHGTEITWIQATDKIMYMASPTTPVVMISYNSETGFTVMPLLLERNKEESDSE